MSDGVLCSSESDESDEGSPSLFQLEISIYMSTLIVVRLTSMASGCHSYYPTHAASLWSGEKWVAAKLSPLQI